MVIFQCHCGGSRFALLSASSSRQVFSRTILGSFGEGWGFLIDSFVVIGWWLSPCFSLTTVLLRLLDSLSSSFDYKIELAR